MQPIKFGTDGWRGLIAEDYTFDNVRRAAWAIANYIGKNEDSRRGAVVGYDTRFGSRMFAQTVAEVLSAAGIDVRLASDYTPTPALSFGVKHFGAAGGVMITSSHNPFNWNGVKYKASYGGSGRPAIMQAIEAELDKPVPKGSKAGTISDTDFKQPYIEAIKKLADLEKITAAGFKFLIDYM